MKNQFLIFPILFIFFLVSFAACDSTTVSKEKPTTEPTEKSASEIALENPPPESDCDTAWATYLVHKGLTLIDSGFMDSSLVFFQDARRIHYCAYDKPNETVLQSYMNEASILGLRGQYREANIYWDSLITILNQSFQQNHHIWQKVDGNKRIILKELNKHDESKAYLDERFKIYSKDTLNFKKALTVLHRHYASYFSHQGQFDSTRVHAEKSLKFGEDVADEIPGEIAQILTTLAGLEYEEGNFEGAIKYQKRILEVTPNKGAFKDKIAETYYKIGRIYKRQGNYDKATDQYKKSLEIIEEMYGSNTIKAGYILSGMGSSHGKATGDFKKANEFLHRAIQIFEDALPSYNRNTATAYHNMGYNLRTLKQSKEAEKAILKAIENYSNTLGKDHFNTHISNILLGRIYSEQGSPEKGLGLVKKGVEVLKATLGAEHFLYGSGIGNLSEIYLDLQQYDKAEEKIEESIRVYGKAKGENHPDMASSYSSQADIFFAQNKFEATLKAIEKGINVLDQAEKEKNLPPKSLTTNIRADLLRLKAQTLNQIPGYGAKDVLNVYEEIFDLVDANRGGYLNEESIKVLNEEIFDDLKKAVELSIDLSKSDPLYLKNAFQFSEKSRSYRLLLSLQTVIAEAFLPDDLALREKDLRSEIKVIEGNTSEKSKNKKPEVEGFGREDELFELKRQYIDLLAEIKTKAPDYYQVKYEPQKFDKTSYQSTISDDEALLEYFVGDKTIHAFLITKNNFKHIGISNDFDLSENIEKLRSSILKYYLSDKKTPELYTSSNQKYVESASLLHEKLIDEIGDLPKNITIIPSDEISYLPFEVLLSAKPKSENSFADFPYLLKEHSVSYAYSATWLQKIIEKKIDNKKLVAFAPEFQNQDITYSDIDTYRSENLGKLENNILEANQITADFGGTSFIGETASLENFKTKIHDAGIIHLATHSKVHDSDPELSWLAFTPQTDTGKIDKIYLRDLSGLQLNAEMVVLSACETGMGKLQKGEGVMSLANAFSQAGAKSIITSLWSVNDKSTYKLMTDFYKNLASGQTKNAALTNSKLNYLAQSDHEKSHPFYWGAFVPIGNMDTLSPAGFGYWIPLLAMVGIGLFGWMYFRQK